MNTAYLEKLFGMDGKKAVITGSASGLGRAIAYSLSQFGAEVFLLDRNPEGLAESAQIIREAGGACHTYELDISDTQAQDRFFDEFLQKEKHLDIFVADAGINIRSELPDAKLEDIKTLLQTNYIGTVYGMIRAANIMKPQRSGNILVITSVNGVSPLINQAVYSSIKAGLEGAMRCLAGTMAEYGVRVNSCAPGCIYSNGNKHMFSQEVYRKAKEANIPLGKIGNPEDIGDVVAAVVSDAFRFMVGSTVLVDGGEIMRPKQVQP